MKYILVLIEKEKDRHGSERLNSHIIKFKQNIGEEIRHKFIGRLGDINIDIDKKGIIKVNEL